MQTPAKRPILNSHVPHPPWLDPRGQRLPGIAPLDPADWIWVLDSYAGQLAERERLLLDCPQRVMARTEGTGDALSEMYTTVLSALEARRDFHRTGLKMLCPDGREVHLDGSDPLRTLGRLVQEDLCLLQKPRDSEEHLLTAAVLCFPANWTLSEKIGRPLRTVHRPVEDYDEDLARRVQRLLDGVKPERPLWRWNALMYDDPSLFQPGTERDSRSTGGENSEYLRSERQCLVRLPKSGAVVFSIHTMMIRRDAADSI